MRPSSSPSGSESTAVHLDEQIRAAGDEARRFAVLRLEGQGVVEGGGRCVELSHERQGFPIPGSVATFLIIMAKAGRVGKG